MNEKLKKVRKIALRILLGLLLLLCAAIASGLSYRAYKRSSIRKAAEITTPNGIESLEAVTLGGSKQWIYLRGHDRENPVLLYLHGGPGFPEMAYARDFGLQLEEHFTVVHWDQRASGKSRREAYTDDSLTLDQFLEDTLELIEMLRERFDEDRIYLLGHSWGTVLGAHTARNHPELLHAYIAMGQVVNIDENEAISYQFVVDEARKEGNEKALAELAPLTPPYAEDPDELFIQRKWLLHYHGSILEGSIVDAFAGMFISPEYSLADCVATIQGMTALAHDMWPDLSAVDMYTQVPRLEVPVYFLTGRHDYNTPFELVEKYCEVLEAPKKEIIWFEDSAHMPNIEEPARFQEVIISKILRETHDDTEAASGNTP